MISFFFNIAAISKGVSPFLFPLFYEGYNFGLLIGVLTLLIIAYNYYVDGSSGSMWCWIVNSIMIYYIGYLLLYLPFKNG